MRSGSPKINEFLLVGDSGSVPEGSQTNFYAVMNGVLHTAGEGVLEGTVRRLLLEVCEREGVPVSTSEPPMIKDVERWEGCMISSTSRLLLPVDELYMPEENKPSRGENIIRTFEYGDGDLAVRLSSLVLAEVLAHSTKIVEVIQ
jgi:thiol oxidase